MKTKATSKKILKVINNFKKVLPLVRYEYHLDMLHGDVNKGQECGTVHCHGGWYAVAACDTSKRLTYADGADKMADDMGFDDKFALARWADMRTDLWGNAQGSRMFNSRYAFHNENKRPKGALNLQHIIDHWTEVYERVKQSEK